MTASKLMESVRKTTRLIPEKSDSDKPSIGGTYIDFIPKIEIESNTKYSQ